MTTLYFAEMGEKKFTQYEIDFLENRNQFLSTMNHRQLLDFINYILDGYSSGNLFLEEEVELKFWCNHRLQDYTKETLQDFIVGNNLKIFCTRNLKDVYTLLDIYHKINI